MLLYHYHIMYSYGIFKEEKINGSFEAAYRFQLFLLSVSFVSAVEQTLTGNSTGK